MGYFESTVVLEHVWIKTNIYYIQNQLREKYFDLLLKKYEK